MANPVSSAQVSQQASQATQPATRQPQPQQQSSAVHDKVTLKSTSKQNAGDVDHDGDKK